MRTSLAGCDCLDRRVADIDKIYSFGANLGPDAEKAYREWAQKYGVI